MNIHFLFSQRSLMTRQSVRRIVSVCLLLFFAAHAFCFFNPTYSGASVMVNAAKGASAQLAQGRWLQPIYFALRGGISSPLVVGMLSALYLAATAIVLADLLGVIFPVPQILLCCVVCVNPYLISIFAGSMHTADALILAQLLSACGIWLSIKVRRRFGFFPSLFLLCGAHMLDYSALFFACVLLYVYLISELLRQADYPYFLNLCRMFKTYLHAVLPILFALILLCAAHIALIFLRGTDPVAQISGASDVAEQFFLSFPQITVHVLETLFSPVTAYPSLAIVLRVLLAALSIIALVSFFIHKSKGATLTILVLAALLPAAAFTPSCSRDPAPQFFASYMLLDLVPVLIIFHPFCRMRSSFRRIAVCAIAVLTLGMTVFANQVYLKKNLEAQSTLSYMTRVIDRIEQTDGYNPGYTPVAIIGTPEDSALSMEHVGFEHLSALDAAKNNYAITTYEDMIWYTWEIMGYPLNFVSTFEQEQLAMRDEIAAMPAFPGGGSCTFVGDTLVVKLSETE